MYSEYICWKFAGRLLDRVNTPLDSIVAYVSNAADQVGFVGVGLMTEQQFNGIHMSRLSRQHQRRTALLEIDQTAIHLTATKRHLPCAVALWPERGKQEIRNQNIFIKNAKFMAAKLPL